MRNSKTNRTGARGLMRGVGFLTLLIAALAVLASGCAGPLKVEYGPTPGADGAKPAVTGTKGATLSIERFADARQGLPDTIAGQRTIGEVTSVVSGMRSGPLVLADDVTDMVTNAVSSELSAAGYDVAADAPEYVLSGEVKRFRLDIKERDRIDITLGAKVEHSSTGEVVWTGAGEYVNDRYAGVFGNSRKTISAYLSLGMKKAIGGMLPELTAAIDADRTRRAAPPAPAAPATPTTVAPPAPTPAPAAQPTGPAVTGQGTLTIETTPSSAMVYIDGIYYGLTPITIDMEPGIYELSLRRRGYRDENEKVSVRPAQTTRMDVEFEER